MMITDARCQILVIAFILQITGLQAQDSTNRYFILGARYNYGVVFRHSQALAEEIQTNPVGYQLDASWHYKSRDAREYCNCYPKLGLSFYYWDYRKPEILGHGLTLLAFAEPFFNAHNRIAFSLRAGLGLNYQDQPYDSVDNPLNLAYSTRFAFAALINLSANIRLTSHLKLTLAANYNHISNGGVKLPNKGLNYPSFSAGLDYSFKKSHFTRIKDLDEKKEEFRMRWRKDFGIYLGFRGITDDEKLYYVYGIFGQFAWQFGRVSALPIGLDFTHDRAELARSEIYPSISSRAANKLSFYTGYDYILGKMVLSFNLGAYLYSPDRISVWLYQRYIVRVKVYKFIIAGLSLKAHGHIAEFFDVRIGMSF
jgi:hypothetical protein